VKEERTTRKRRWRKTGRIMSGREDLFLVPWVLKGGGGYMYTYKFPKSNVRVPLLSVRVFKLFDFSVGLCMAILKLQIKQRKKVK
jgi:hypothetical protein